MKELSNHYVQGQLESLRRGFATCLSLNLGQTTTAHVLEYFEEELKNIEPDDVKFLMEIALTVESLSEADRAITMFRKVKGKL